MIKNTHTVSQLISKQFLVDYAIGLFDAIPTKSSIKKALKKGFLKVNHQQVSSSFMVHGGELLSLEQKTIKPSLKLILDVVYEDDYIAIINKPSGILVSGNTYKTIANALAHNLRPSTQKDALITPLATHRLDYPTSGLLLIAKTTQSRIKIGELFENKHITKTYLAVTIGEMEQKGKINFTIDDKTALTQFEVLQTITSKRFQYLNHVKLQPITGRRHQLRKHLFTLGNPILGDPDYYLEHLQLKGKGLYLHACELTFTHPFTKKKLSVKSEFSKKFRKLFFE